MPKDFIVAIELGSSKMTGIAGKKNLDGSTQVLAVVKEDSSSFIRKGYVNNIDKTAKSLNYTTNVNFFTIIDIKIHTKFVQSNY